MRAKDPEVWILGSKNPNADRSTLWNQSTYPNFHEPDVLIINLDSLTETILHIDKTKFQVARNQIFTNFINGGNIIYMISRRREAQRKNAETTVARKYSGRYSTKLSPIDFQIQITEGSRIKSYSDEFSHYFDYVKKFTYYLHDFKISSSLKNVKTTNEFATTIVQALRSPHDSRDPLDLVTNEIALDNSAHVLSAICSIKLDGYWQTGNAIYLPPTTEISVEESIDVLLQIYGKQITRETIPQWAYAIELPDIKDIDLKIMNLEDEKAKIQQMVDTELKRKRDLENHYRLLVSKGHTLEDAVYDAFKVLGFEEIEKKRGNNFEDWVFEFRTIPKYKYGIIEVKGNDTRTGLRDLRQCANWVFDYLQEGVHTKGVFVPNQYRLEKYPDSIDRRSHFEPNEKNFAEQQEICIIPSCLLFDTLRKLLSRGRQQAQTCRKSHYVIQRSLS